MEAKPGYWIVLSGGAIFGGFQVGVLREIYNLDLPIKGVVGTSVGAINGAMFAQHDMDELERIWLEEILTTKDLYKNWPLWYPQGIFKGGLVNNDPIVSKLRNCIDVPALISSDIRFTSCSVNMRSGLKKYVESTKENENVILDYIIASMSYPIFFPPIEIDGYKYTDGGLREPIPVKQAAISAGPNDKLIIILTKKVTSKPLDTLSKRLWHLIPRAMSIMFEEIYQTDLNTFCKLHQKEDRDIIIEPPVLRFEHSFDVSHDKILRSYEDGIETAKGIKW